MKTEIPARWEGKKRSPVTKSAAVYYLGELSGNSTGTQVERGSDLS